MEAKKWKVTKCMSYLCCWRQNRQYDIELTNDEKLRFERTEKLVLTSKIFKHHKQKSNVSSAQLSMVSLDLDFNLSLQDLLQIDDQ